MNASIELVVNALRIIGGKWKIAILYQLNKSPCRFGELKNSTSYNTANADKAIEGVGKDGLISRRVYAVIPPKVEHSLTQFGFSLKPVISSLCKSVNKNHIE